MAEAAITGRPVEWPTAHKTIVLRGGENAQYLGRCEITGKHRVRTFREWGNPESIYTTWLLDDLGRCRGDLAPSDLDYVPARPAA